jgi:hypothetical protein
MLEVSSDDHIEYAGFKLHLEEKQKELIPVST